jgi:amino acid adenylation domain-containing protein
MKLPEVPFLESEIHSLIPARFHQVANQVPDRPALVTNSEVVSYFELDIISDKYAQAIRSLDRPKNSLFVILIEQGVTATAAILGVLKAGGSYIIFSPDTPVERLKVYWEDAAHPILLTNVNCRSIALEFAGSDQILNLDETIPDNAADSNALKPQQPDNMAAIFYTSGSTGQPKGVIWSHELILHTAFVNQQSYRIAPEDRILVLSAYGFGSNMTMNFAALLTGATLFQSSLFQQNLTTLVSQIIENKITILAMPQSGLLHQILGALKDPAQLKHVRLIILGGEDLDKQDIESFQKGLPRTTQLVYRLAGSETMLMRELKIDPSMQFPEGKIPVGYAVKDKELLLLSDEGENVPDGMVGEIAIRSRYLATGYWRQKDLTAKKFLKQPNALDKRIYLTGDLGRLNEQGQLEFMGRKDNMVKIRGFSVQLEAIELALQQLTTIEEAAVALKPGSRENRLIAYLIPRAETKKTVSELKSALGKKLPGHMIPSTFVWLDDFPRTATGKVDRNRLPLPAAQRPDLSTPYKAPNSELELKLASIWQKLLSLEQVGVEDNFFELGGDSLTALEMSLELEHHLSISLHKSFFQNPTISSLIQVIKSSDSQAPPREDHFQSSLSSKPDEGSKMRSPSRPISRVRKRIKNHKFSIADLSKGHRLIEELVAAYCVQMPFEEAQAWAVKWSRSSFVQQVFYRKRRTLFNEWLAVLSQGKIDLPGNFQLNLLNNIYFRLPKTISKEDKITIDVIKAYRSSPYPYWRSLGELIDTRSIQELEKIFPINGLKILKKAYQQGKGVILLSFHGTPRPGHLYPLARRLGIKRIPTISYKIPLRQSGRSSPKTLLSETDVATMNAEIAVYGQRKLKEGAIINFASDTEDVIGKTFRLSMGGRIYQMKAGFAEMALNTGALVLPFTRYCLPDGRVQMDIFPPLQVENGRREKQVESMLQIYVDFIEQCWRTHPEAISWTRMNRHLEQPSGEDHQ